MRFTTTITFKKPVSKLYGKPLGLKYLDLARKELGNHIEDVRLDSTKLLVKFSPPNKESNQVLTEAEYVYNIKDIKGSLSFTVDEAVARSVGNIFNEYALYVADMPDNNSWDDYLDDPVYVLDPANPNSALAIYTLNLVKLLRDIRNPRTIE